MCVPLAVPVLRWLTFHRVVRGPGNSTSTAVATPLRDCLSSGKHGRTCHRTEVPSEHWQTQWRSIHYGPPVPPGPFEATNKIAFCKGQGRIGAVPLDWILRPAVGLNGHRLVLSYGAEDVMPRNFGPLMAVLGTLALAATAQRRRRC